MTGSYLDILLLALLVGFIGWRLFSVLGRRTGHENPQADMRGSSAPAKSSDATADNVVNIQGGRDAATAPGAGGQGILDIQLADRNFDPNQFISGAKAAYEMIVVAFASGNRNELRPLLSDDVYDDFDNAIRAREAEGKRVETNFIGIDSASITDARLENNRHAEVTVKFVSEMITVVKNEDGAVIEGDPTTVRKVTDIWTFARDTRSSDPNWVLISTDEE